jgi:phage shock protein PspC (stress-responsive transcriptional regulator)
LAIRRLYRSNRERILGGVSGGLAEYFEIDVTLVRLAWIIAVLAGGFGVLAYIIAWIIIPENPVGRGRPAAGEAEGLAEAGPDAAGDAPGRARAGGEAGEETGRCTSRPGGGYWVFGLILVALGTLLLLRNFFPLFQLGKYWPVLIILLGALVIACGLGRRSEEGE